MPAIPRLGLAFCGLLLLFASPLAAADRPNILFVFADDWGRYASAYAATEGPGTINDLLHTPNFDRVAREGVLFRNAYVSAPSCTPCRSALLSGQHFWRTGRGAILRGAVWDESIPAFPLLLRDGGYQIGQTGKVWSPGTPNDAPFGGTKYAYDKSGMKFNQFSQNVTKEVASGKPLDAAKQAIYDQVAANFDAFLADREPGKPFLYWFGPTNVHRKWVQGSGQALWGLNPDDLKGKLPPFLPDEPVVREDVASYCGEIQAFDGMLGVLLAKLEAMGELDNTLIIVSGDHGPPGFPNGKCNLYDFGTIVPLAIRWKGAKGGRVVDDLVSLTDIAPTLLEVAGLTPPDVMTGRSFVNVLTSDRNGQVDPQRTAVYSGRERHVEDAHADYTPYPQRTIRTPEYRFIINFEPDRYPLGDPYRLDGDNPLTEAEITDDTRLTLSDMDASPTKGWLVANRNDPRWRDAYERTFGKRPREELYVLADDPHQMNNVANDPRYAGVASELREKLLAELKRTNDPRVTGDGLYFETPPLAGPLEKE